MTTTVSIAKLDIHYAHRFQGYEGEEKYLHGHSATLTIEVEGKVNDVNGVVIPSNSIKRIASEYVNNFDHAIILQENDPLLPAILKVYETLDMRNGTPPDTLAGLPIDTDLAKAYPECRVVVMKKVATCENLIELFHSLLKDKLDIRKMTFSTGDASASFTFVKSYMFK